MPVPAAEPAVAALRARHDPSAANGMPAHITILYPFLAPEKITDSVEREAGLVIARFRAFRFALVRVGLFPRVVYLEPEPAAPFAELTHAFHLQWPDHAPYGGAFETVVPHLTVAQGRRTPPRVERELEEALPIEAEATEVQLMTLADSVWSVRKSFPLAG